VPSNQSPLEQPEGRVRVVELLPHPADLARGHRDDVRETERVARHPHRALPTDDVVAAQGLAVGGDADVVVEVALDLVGAPGDHEVEQVVALAVQAAGRGVTQQRVEAVGLLAERPPDPPAELAQGAVEERVGERQVARVDAAVAGVGFEDLGDLVGQIGDDVLNLRLAHSSVLPLTDTRECCRDNARERSSDACRPQRGPDKLGRTVRQSRS
jgi:hypothetical protein